MAAGRPDAGPRPPAGAGGGRTAAPLTDPDGAGLRPGAGVAVGCRRLTVRFPDRPEPVLREVTLSLAPGERVLLLGPSGCGKSTLAYALSGIIPRSIAAEMEGEVVRPPRVGVLFQDPDAQFCLFTVADEVAFSLENLRVPPEEMPARIARALAQVGLDVPWDTPLQALSGGQRQRLALAVVLALEPDVLFLDEPTSQLDPVGARRAVEAIRRAAEGRTVLLIEHNLDAVVDWVERVVLLGPDGRLVADDTPAAVFRHHAAEVERCGVWWPRSWRPAWSGLAQEAASGAGGAPGPATAPPLVELRGVAAAYGGRRVWEGVDLAIRPGEWVAVVGANGSGKSTLLRVLAGLQPPAAGQVWRHPDLQRPDRELSGVAFVFQNPEHQFVTDTAFDEVALAGRLAGWDEARVRAEAHRLLEEFGLAEVADANPFALSEGQKRRLSVASALLVPHRLVVLDEPTFGQDARTARELVRRIVARWRGGAAVVMATHDLDLVREVATRLLVLAHGRLVYDGPPAAFLDDPRALAAAGLLADAAQPGGEAVPGGPAEPAPAPPLGPDPGRPGRRPLLTRVNPSVKLLLHLAGTVPLMVARHPADAAPWVALPLLTGWLLGGIAPWTVLVRVLPLLLAGLGSLWVLAAYGRGETVLWQWAWLRVTAEGVDQGLTVALRMLGFGLYGVAFALTTDLADLVASLMQQLRLSPRWAYGVLAGLRFLPFFREELEQVRVAHRVRGMARLRGLRGRWEALKRFAVPLLAQAVRKAERVAVALEARGFDGSWNRTFFRRPRPGAADLAYAAALVLLAGLVVAAGRRLGAG